MLEISAHFISFAELNVVSLISSEFHYDYTLYISFNFVLNVGGFSVSNFYFHLSSKNRYKKCICGQCPSKSWHTWYQFWHGTTWHGTNFSTRSVSGSDEQGVKKKARGSKEGVP